MSDLTSRCVGDLFVEKLYIYTAKGLLKDLLIVFKSSKLEL